MTTRPPLPPFTEQTTRQKVQAAEDAWNTRDPRQVALGYTEDSAVRFQYESRDQAGQWWRSGRSGCPRAIAHPHSRVCRVPRPAWHQRGPPVCVPGTRQQDSQP